MVEPVKCQVFDPHVFPIISNLSSSSVNDMSDFIRNSKLKVLGSEFISNKQPIFYFDGSDEIRSE